MLELNLGHIPSSIGMPCGCVSLVSMSTPLNPGIDQGVFPDILEIRDKQVWNSPE